MKSLNERVFDELKKANLIHEQEKFDNVIEKGIVFTNAMRNQEIIDALSEIEDVSLIPERFSGFMNGIVFTIKARQ